MQINTVTVLGANGTMGRNVSAIFASFGKAKVYMMCRSLDKAKQASKKAVQSVRAESIQERLIPVTYEDISKCISESDLVFESLTEDFKVKQQMYKRITPYLKKDAIIATGTSGLSIQTLSDVFDQPYKNRFFGIHMFNPPYSLTLCELISYVESQEKLSDNLKEYLDKSLCRTVIQVKDKPSFLGNRIGFYFIGEALQLAEKMKDAGGIDYVDAILGSFTGRSMAPLVTADFVGLDVTKSILDYIYQNSEDVYQNAFKSTQYLTELIDKKWFGKKTNKGFYYKDKDRNLTYVYDIKQRNYRPVNNYQFYFSNEMISCFKTGKYKDGINILIDDESTEAILCKQMLLKYILYAIKISIEVGSNIADCDDAMATGFSWIPPFALIDLFGGVDIIYALSKKYLSQEIYSIFTNPSVRTRLPIQSKYDYRPFIKAKY